MKVCCCITNCILAWPHCKYPGLWDAYQPASAPALGRHGCCSCHLIPAAPSVLTRGGVNKGVNRLFQANFGWVLIAESGGGLESSDSYPMLKITELQESITHILLVFLGGVW